MKPWTVAKYETTLFPKSTKILSEITRLTQPQVSQDRWIIFTDKWHQTRQETHSCTTRSNKNLGDFLIKWMGDETNQRRLTNKPFGVKFYSSMSVYIFNISGLRGSKSADFGSITAMFYPWSYTRTPTCTWKNIALNQGGWAREGGKDMRCKVGDKDRGRAKRVPVQMDASVGILAGVCLCVCVWRVTILVHRHVEAE